MLGRIPQHYPGIAHRTILNHCELHFEYFHSKRPVFFSFSFGYVSVDLGVMRWKRFRQSLHCCCNEKVEHRRMLGPMLKLPLLRHKNIQSSETKLESVFCAKCKTFYQSKMASYASVTAKMSDQLAFGKDGNVKGISQIGCNR